MLTGSVNQFGIPVIELTLGGRRWPAMLDTGFNGTLGLPKHLASLIECSEAGLTEAVLANGQVIQDQVYLADVEFDGAWVVVEIWFSDIDYILIGTRLLRDHRLTIDFTTGAVRLDRLRTL